MVDGGDGDMALRIAVEVSALQLFRYETISDSKSRSFVSRVRSRQIA